MKVLNLCVRCGVTLEFDPEKRGNFRPTSISVLPCPAHEPSPLFKCRYCGRLLRPPTKPFGAKWLVLEPVTHDPESGLSPLGGCEKAPANKPARHVPEKVKQ